MLSSTGESAAVERGRLAAAQAKQRGELLEAREVEAEWCDVLRLVRAGMLAIPSRTGARLPHLSRDDLAAIEAEVRAALIELAG